eukprot:gene2079-2398_t
MEALGIKRTPPTLMERIKDLLWEVFEELCVYALKIKAWLTPGTTDDKIAEAADQAEDAGDSLKAKFKLT